MRRVIRIDYRFSEGGKVYEGIGVSVGETIEDTTTENENRLSAVCHALGIITDEFMGRYGYPFDWTDADWRKAGFEFEFCEESR